MQQIVMKKYPKYRDSGVEWIGEIPEHWKTLKIRRLFSVSSGNFLPNKFITDTGYPVYGGNGKRGYSSNFNNSGELLLIGRVGAKCGNIHLVNGKYWVSEHALRVFPKKQIHLSYFKYLLETINLNQFAITTAQPLINSEIVLNRLTCLPELTEQISISSFLDHKTSQIDQIIAAKEKLVEKLEAHRKAIINEAVTGQAYKNGLLPPPEGVDLKYKDLGIEWLGEIPEWWEVKKLKEITDAYGRIGYRGYTTSDIVFKGEGAISISPSNMKGDYMTFEDATYISWKKYEESPEIKIFNNDILMVKTGSTYGKVGFVKNLNEKATINPQLLVFKNVRINPDFLFNMLRTPIVQNQVKLNVIGSTIPTISQSKILNFQIVVPPAKEIEKIVSFINDNIVLIDKLNLFISKQIEKLKQYKQSLISEAVTGKIDVRDWKPEND